MQSRRLLRPEPACGEPDSYSVQVSRRRPNLRASMQQQLSVSTKGRPFRSQWYTQTAATPPAPWMLALGLTIPKELLPHADEVIDNDRQHSWPKCRPRRTSGGCASRARATRTPALVRPGRGNGPAGLASRHGLLCDGCRTAGSGPSRLAPSPQPPGPIARLRPIKRALLRDRPVHVAVLPRAACSPCRARRRARPVDRPPTERTAHRSPSAPAPLLK